MSRSYSGAVRVEQIRDAPPFIALAKCSAIKEQNSCVWCRVSQGLFLVVCLFVSLYKCRNKRSTIPASLPRITHHSIAWNVCKTPIAFPSPAAKQKAFYAALFFPLSNPLFFCVMCGFNWIASSLLALKSARPEDIQVPKHSPNFRFTLATITHERQGERERERETGVWHGYCTVTHGCTGVSSLVLGLNSFQNKSWGLH